MNRGTWPPWNPYSKVVILLDGLDFVILSLMSLYEYIIITREMKYSNLYHTGKSSPIRFASSDACLYVWGYLCTSKPRLHIPVLVKVPAGGLEAKDIKPI